MGGRGEPDAPAAQCRCKTLALLRPIGEGRRPRLERAGDERPCVRRAEGLEPAGALGVLRTNEREAAVQIGIQPPNLPFRPVGRRIHAPVDQRERDPAPAGFDDERRPDVAFGPDGKVGSPVVQKGAHETHAIHRKELVTGVRWHVRSDRVRRCPGGAREQHVEIWHPLQHRQHEARQGENLADTDRMHPHQRAGRSRQGRDTELLPVPLGIFLAAREAPREVAARERVRGTGEEHVQAQEGPHADRLRHHQCSRS